MNTTIVENHYDKDTRMLYIARLIHSHSCLLLSLCLLCFLLSFDSRECFPLSESRECFTLSSESREGFPLSSESRKRFPLSSTSRVYCFSPFSCFFSSRLLFFLLLSSSDSFLESFKEGERGAFIFSTGSSFRLVCKEADPSKLLDALS